MAKPTHIITKRHHSHKSHASITHTCPMEEPNAQKPRANRQLVSEEGATGRDRGVPTGIPDGNGPGCGNGIIPPGGIPPRFMDPGKQTECGHAWLGSRRWPWEIGVVRYAPRGGPGPRIDLPAPPPPATPQPPPSPPTHCAWQGCSSTLGPRAWALGPHTSPTETCTGSTRHAPLVTRFPSPVVVVLLRSS